jgi:excinuclease UvrABC nuclease subunit
MRESMFDLNLKRIGFVSEAANVYWLYDKDDVLIYVGSTISLRARLRHHRQNTHWFRKANRLKTDFFETREKAIVVEKEAIREEAPIHNYQGQASVLDCPTYASFGRLKERVQERLW